MITATEAHQKLLEVELNQWAAIRPEVEKRIDQLVRKTIEVGKNKFALDQLFLLKFYTKTVPNNFESYVIKLLKDNGYKLSERSAHDWISWYKIKNYSLIFGFIMLSIAFLSLSIRGMNSEKAIETGVTYCKTISTDCIPNGSKNDKPVCFCPK